MSWQVRSSVPNNSAAWFEQALITENGFREYDVRWQLGKEINPNGFLVLGRAFGTYVRTKCSASRRSSSATTSGNTARTSAARSWSACCRRASTSPTSDWPSARSSRPASPRNSRRHDATASHNENGWTGLKLADGLSSTLGPDGIRASSRLSTAAVSSDRAGSFRTTCSSWTTGEPQVVLLEVGETLLEVGRRCLVARRVLLEHPVERLDGLARSASLKWHSPIQYRALSAWSLSGKRVAYSSNPAAASA